MMHTIKYTSFMCDYDSLEARLNELGSQGWRLHTCEPVPLIGPQGTGSVRAFVVMDMLVEHAEENQTEAEPRPEGIAMRG